MSTPIVVELQRFCDQSRTLETESVPTQLPRLLESVADSQGRVSMRVRGFIDARGRPSLDFSAEAALGVLCTRCLRPMPVVVEVQQTLAFDNAEIDDELDLDTVETLPMVQHLDLVELLEEELLLALPMLPKHDACEAPGPATIGRTSVFSGLQGLMDSTDGTT